MIIVKLLTFFNTKILKQAIPIVIFIGVRFALKLN